MKSGSAIIGFLVFFAVFHVARAGEVESILEVTYAEPNGNHGFSNSSRDWPDFRAATINFLKKHLLK